jgi:hypothetical protein
VLLADHLGEDLGDQSPVDAAKERGSHRLECPLGSLGTRDGRESRHYVGVDLHRKRLYLVAMDDTGAVMLVLARKD